MRPFAPGSSPLTRGKRRVFRRSVGVRRLIPAHAGKTSSPQCTRSACAAHPRSRGENVVADTKKFSRAGSSPLTRGKHRLADRLQDRERLIPAHAGKTARPQSRSRAPAAHPRSRGENSFRRDSAGIKGGSSPLTRGKPPRVRRAGGQQRLIPAHAGKTRCDRRRGRSYGAHPRSRGENSFAKPLKARENGSSPLTRGKPVEHLRDRRPRRLIPAHAGKTRTRGPTHRRTKAHPRSRGENRGPHAALFVRGGSSPLTRGKPNRRLSHRPGSGSSPLTRGKLHVPRLAIPRGRLIPAHAGKTDRIAPSLTLRTAHPRSRGENTRARASSMSTCGSSPLTRGKRRQHQGRQRPVRLIPAHAGKTIVVAIGALVAAAHPRSRGENMQAAMQLTRDNGSSPLTRGKRGGSPATRVGDRLIPAHAGKTWWRPPPSTRCAAHPRSRGENRRRFRRSYVTGGSSPLTRGKPSL